MLVIPNGPACHTGQYSCFSKESGGQVDGSRFDIINKLEAVIAEREAERPEGSYTTYLFEKGLDKILKRLEKKLQRSLLQQKPQP